MSEAKIVCSACRTRLLGSDHSSEGDISRCPRCGARIGVGVRGSNSLKSGSSGLRPARSIGVVVGWAVAIPVLLGLGSLARDRGQGPGSRPHARSSRWRSPSPRPSSSGNVADRPPRSTPSSPGPARVGSCSSASGCRTTPGATAATGSAPSSTTRPASPATTWEAWAAAVPTARTSTSSRPRPPTATRHRRRVPPGDVPGVPGTTRRRRSTPASAPRRASSCTASGPPRSTTPGGSTGWASVAGDAGAGEARQLQDGPPEILAKLDIERSRLPSGPSAFGHLREDRVVSSRRMVPWSQPAEHDRAVRRGPDRLHPRRRPRSGGRAQVPRVPGHPGSSQPIGGWEDRTVRVEGADADAAGVRPDRLRRGTRAGGPRSPPGGRSHWSRTPGRRGWT